MWVATVAQHLQDELPTLIADLEQAIRERVVRQTADADAARQRAQRQVQAYDALERRYATTARAREIAGTTLLELRGELKQVIAGWEIGAQRS